MTSFGDAGNLRDLVVYVSHSFSPAYDRFTAVEFRECIAGILSEVERSLNGIQIRPFFTNEDYHTGLQEAIRRKLDASDYAIVDISDGSRSVMYECGYLSAREVDTLLIKSEASQSKLPFPERYADIGDRTVCFYSDLSDLKSKCFNAVHQKIREKAARRRVKDDWVYEIWFPASCRNIRVVCPQIAEPGEYSHRSSPDFTYLDNLGDTDTLLETMVFLSRHYPKAVIEKYSSKDFPGQLIGGNLVVIGGPGNDESFGNSVAGIMMAELKSRVAYTQDCDSMILSNGKESTTLVPSICESRGPVSGDLGVTVTDHGYFAAGPNPMNSDSRVVLINGVHTAGVLGAFRAFSDHSDSFGNYVSLLGDILRSGGGIIPAGNMRSFEAVVDVRVVGGYVKVPSINHDRVWLLD